MNRQQKFLLGVGAGAAATFAWKGRATRHSIDFAGRRVVITGGSRGLGLVLARQLAAEGARLCLSRATRRNWREPGRSSLEGAREVMTIRCDVRRRADVRIAMDRIFERMARG